MLDRLLLGDWVTRAAVAAVALVAAVVSYAHLVTLATAVGEPAMLAYLLPLSVDGLAVVASVAAWRCRSTGVPVPATTYLALVLGIAVSVAANVLVTVLPYLSGTALTVLSACVTGWAPLALALAGEQALRLLAGQAVEHEPEPVAAEPVAVDVRQAALGILRQDPATTSARLAEMVGRSERWARNIRKEFKETGEVLNGKTYV